MLAVALVPAAVSATPAVRQWTFDVSADGIPIGTHEFVIRDDQGTRTVRSDMRFRVRLLIVDAYRFEHTANETWRDDCLSQLDTRTDERGQITAVSGRLDAGGFEIDGTTGRAVLPACVMTFAYWNPRVTRQSHLLNAQTGAWTPVSSDRLGVDLIEVRGQPQKADHYRLSTAKNQIELWYAPDGGDWLAMRTTTRDGHVLTYTLR